MFKMGVQYMRFRASLRSLRCLEFLRSLRSLRCLTKNGLLTTNQSGFSTRDSTTNQILYLLSEIHESFEDPERLEVRAVFLDISKAFDKVGLNDHFF